MRAALARACVVLAVVLTMAAPALAQDVDVDSNFFSPADLTVSQGDTVTWNLIAGFHSVTANDASFDSGAPMGTTFQHTFATIGSFPYYCAVHSSSTGTAMNAIIRVVAASGGDQYRRGRPRITLSARRSRWVADGELVLRYGVSVAGRLQATLLRRGRVVRRITRPGMAGSHTLRARNLRAGRYVVRLRAYSVAGRRSVLKRIVVRVH